MDPRPQPEGSYKIGSLCQSFRLSASFLGIGTLVFSETWTFGLFKNITSLVLSGICVKWKFLWLSNILRKPHASEKSVSQVITKKWLLANEISLFFNCQYFTNRLVSHFDFWHVGRDEWKKQGSLTGFLKKFSFVEMGHFGSKNCASS